MGALHLAIFFDLADEADERLGAQAFFVGDVGFELTEAGGLAEVVHREPSLLIDETSHAAAIVGVACATPDLLYKKQLIVRN